LPVFAGLARLKMFAVDKRTSLFIRMTKMFYTPFTSMMETIQAQLAAQGTILKSIIESSITLDQ
jgi:hypothetical protein